MSDERGSAPPVVGDPEDDPGDWQVKDYGDGWITCPDRASAEKYQRETGALMRYRRYYPALSFCGRCDKDTPTTADGKCPFCTKYKVLPDAPEASPPKMGLQIPDELVRRWQELCEKGHGYLVSHEMWKFLNAAPKGRRICACPADVCAVEQDAHCRRTGAYNPPLDQPSGERDLG